MRDSMDNASQTTRILIADESRMVRATLIKLIRKHYEFREEVDGESAWQALVLDHSIRLVICAASLPMLDGDALLARIRSSRLARLRQMPLLMIAGDNVEANERARALGVSDLISRGISSGELLERIDAQLRLASAHQDLRQGPEIDSPHPLTGLPARRHMELQATRAISQAMRFEGPVSVIIAGFDRFDALRDEHGVDLASELLKRFAGMLGKKVRKEDSLGHYSDSDLAIVSPGTPYPACETFAKRLCDAFAIANIAVHGQRLDLTVSFGVANTPVDRAGSAAGLLDLAARRLAIARKAGGNRVVACADKPLSEATIPSVSRALDLIKAENEQAVIPHLVALGKEIMPFLRLLERELELGLPLADLQKRMLDREQEIQDTRQA